MRYKSMVILLHISASSGHPQGGIKQKKIQQWQFMS